MIADEITKVSYTGDGVTTAFPFSFPFAAAADIKALIYNVAENTETAITSDYYIDSTSGVFYYPGYAPGQEPAEANQPPKLTSGQKIYIYRDTPETQLIDLGEKYPLPIVEGMHDKLTMIVQEHAEKLERCIKTSIASTISFDAVIVEEIYRRHDETVASAAQAAASATAAGISETNAGSSATAAAGSALSALGYRDAAQGYSTNASSSATTAAANAQSVISLADTVRGYAQAAGDSATTAGSAASGAQHWAELANEYTEPLRAAMLTSMFEYDSNADLQLVANPMASASTTWETDSSGDVMPAA